MNELEKYFILLVIVWRLTHLVSMEDGPFDIIIRIRKALSNSFYGKLMDCFYCLSIWIGLGVAVYAGRNSGEMIVLTLYYSGASLLLEKLTNKNFV